MASKRAFSFRRGDNGYFATLRGEPRIGGMITRSASKGSEWYWSLGDEHLGGLFVDGWARTLTAARDDAEAAGKLMLEGIHPRHGGPLRGKVFVAAD